MVVGSGIQFGKTAVGAVKTKIAAHTFTHPEDNHLVLAPTYKVMQQSTLPPFLRFMAGCGEYKKADGEFKIYGGGTIYLRTGTDPDSIVGITNVRSIWGDEAGLFSLYFWENIQARASFRQAQITLTTSPYSLNWLYKELIKPKIKDAKARPDVELIQARSDENPYFPRAEYERKKLTMDPRRFAMVYGGSWERPAGLVYDCFDDEENQCEPFALPTGTKYFGGIDWGFTEPFVFVVRGITPDGQHYQVAEYYKSGSGISDLGNAVARMCAVFDVGAIYAGPDQPGLIVELNGILKRAGLRAHVIAANNDVRLGIDRHYELVKTRRYKVFKSTSPYTLDEYDSYHYPDPDDVKPDQSIKEAKPVGQNDHALDANRYLTISTHFSDVKRAPVVPGEEKKYESMQQKIIRLKKGPGGRGNTENWS